MYILEESTKSALEMCMLTHLRPKEEGEDLCPGAKT